MARKPRQSQRKVPDTNGIDPDLAKAFVRRIESEHAELDSLRASYMNSCKGPRGRIKDAYTEGRQAGIPTKSLKAEIEGRLLARKLEKTLSALDTDERSAFDQLAEALGEFGDLPLGRAALDEQRARDGEEFDRDVGEAGEATSDADADNERGSEGEALGEREPSYSTQ